MVTNTDSKDSASVGPENCTCRQILPRGPRHAGPKLELRSHHDASAPQWSVAPYAPSWPLGPLCQWPGGPAGDEDSDTERRVNLTPVMRPRPAY
jgi:hypothetical protein